MRNKNLILHAALLLVGLILLSCNRADIPDRPNIILIISDDQGWTDYSFLGHPHIETPRIDQLAEEGLTFTRGYTTAPVCRPALAAIATGLYPHQNGVLGNDPLVDFEKDPYWTDGWFVKRAEYEIPLVENFEKLPSLPDLLGEAGYVSLQTGKWWEGHYQNGGFTEGMTHGDPALGGRHGDEGLTIGREGLDVIYDFIDHAGQEDTPFFVWYAPFLPHLPHTPPDSLIDKYLPLAPTPLVAQYWATCEWFDITCGELVDFVEHNGLSENTMFVYVTDNGWVQDPEQPWQWDLKSKLSPYEMGIRTPMIFRWKGVIEPEMDQSSLASSIDIASTILGICGIPTEPDMQGINLLNEEARKGRDAVFAEDYNHHFYSPDSSLYHRVIVSDSWKLILPDPVNKPDDSVELYQIVEDPHETDNKAEAQPEIVDSLTDRIETWWTENNKD